MGIAACLQAFLLIPGLGRSRPLGASRPWSGSAPCPFLVGAVCRLLPCCAVGSLIGVSLVLRMRVNACCHLVAQVFDHSFRAQATFESSRSRRKPSSSYHCASATLGISIYLPSVVAERAVNRPARPWRRQHGKIAAADYSDR